MATGDCSITGQPARRSPTTPALFVQGNSDRCVAIRLASSSYHAKMGTCFDPRGLFSADSKFGNEDIRDGDEVTTAINE
ncbi:MAG: hypothetical protein CMJ46_14595 [Planctomyces sp.]|nr:hypothetical protein [Planctomyces sp.]